MTRSEIRQLIEDVTDATAIKLIGPIDKRLTRIETTIEINKMHNQRRRDTFWKLLTLSASIPAVLYTLLNLIGIL